MLTRAGEVGSMVVTTTAEPALGLGPSGAPFPNIQHSDSVQMGPMPMPPQTICRCVISTDIGVLHNLQPDSMWLACHRGSEWIYGRCRCERKDDKILHVTDGSALLSDSQPDPSVIVDLVTINTDGHIQNTVWRVPTSLILESCVG